MPNLRNKWGKDVKKALIGRQIVDARYMTDQEMEDFGWHRSGICIFLDNGDYLISSQDDEGNSAGALFTNIEGLEVIPTV